MGSEIKPSSLFGVDEAPQPPSPLTFPLITALPLTKDQIFKGENKEEKGKKNQCRGVII